ncbi:transposase family protein [Streptomyces gardneri]
MRCPRCGSLSSRVHGRHERNLADTAAGTAPVVRRLMAGRFRCLTSGGQR